MLFSSPLRVHTHTHTHTHTHRPHTHIPHAHTHLSGLKGFDAGLCSGCALCSHTSALIVFPKHTAIRRANGSPIKCPSPQQDPAHRTSPLQLGLRGRRPLQGSCVHAFDVLAIQAMARPKKSLPKHRTQPITPGFPPRSFSPPRPCLSPLSLPKTRAESVHAFNRPVYQGHFGGCRGGGGRRCGAGLAPPPPQK
jgi:hypothetical protein